MIPTPQGPGPGNPELDAYIRRMVQQKLQEMGAQVDDNYINQAVAVYSRPGSPLRQQFFKEKADQAAQEAQHAQLGGSFGDAAQRFGRDALSGAIKGITAPGFFVAKHMGLGDDVDESNQILNDMSGEGMGGRGLSANPVLGTLQSAVEPAAEMATNAKMIGNRAFAGAGNLLNRASVAAPASQVLRALAPAGKTGILQNILPEMAKGVIGSGISMPDAIGTGQGAGYAGVMGTLGALSHASGAMAGAKVPGGSLLDAIKSGSSRVNQLFEPLEAPNAAPGSVPPNTPPPAPQAPAPVVPNAAAQSLWAGATDLGRGKFLGLPQGTPSPAIPWEKLTDVQRAAIIQNTGGTSSVSTGNLGAQTTPPPFTTAPDLSGTQTTSGQTRPSARVAKTPKPLAGGDKEDLSTLDAESRSKLDATWAGLPTINERAKALGVMGPVMGEGGAKLDPRVIENIQNAKTPDDLMGYLQRRLMKTAGVTKPVAAKAAAPAAAPVDLVTQQLETLKTQMANGEKSPKPATPADAVALNSMAGEDVISSDIQPIHPEDLAQAVRDSNHGIGDPARLRATADYIQEWVAQRGWDDLPKEYGDYAKYHQKGYDALRQAADRIERRAPAPTPINTPEQVQKRQWYGLTGEPITPEIAQINTPERVQKRVTGTRAEEDILDPQNVDASGRVGVIVHKGELITPEIAQKIAAAGIETPEVGRAKPSARKGKILPMQAAAPEAPKADISVLAEADRNAPLVQQSRPLKGKKATPLDGAPRMTDGTLDWDKLSAVQKEAAAARMGTGYRMKVQGKTLAQVQASLSNGQFDGFMKALKGKAPAPTGAATGAESAPAESSEGPVQELPLGGTTPRGAKLAITPSEEATPGVEPPKAASPPASEVAPTEFSAVAWDRLPQATKVQHLERLLGDKGAASVQSLLPFEDLSRGLRPLLQKDPEVLSSLKPGAAPEGGAPAGATFRGKRRPAKKP